MISFVGLRVQNPRVPGISRVSAFQSEGRRPISFQDCQSWRIISVLKSEREARIDYRTLLTKFKIVEIIMVILVCFQCVSGDS